MTADRVMSRPKTRPMVGERSIGDGWDTPRGYNGARATVTVRNGRTPVHGASVDV
jgi:hypothetical protein